MAMFSIITIPFEQKTKGFDDELLNKFVLNKQVKSHRAEFFQNSDVSYGTVFLEYDPIISKNSNKETAGLVVPAYILKRINLYIEKLRVIFRISFKRRYISKNQYEYVSTMLNETGKMIGGWKKAV